MKNKKVLAPAFISVYAISVVVFCLFAGIIKFSWSFPYISLMISGVSLVVYLIIFLER